MMTYLSEWESLHKNTACAHPHTVSALDRARRKPICFSLSPRPDSNEKVFKSTVRSTISHLPTYIYTIAYIREKTYIKDVHNLLAITMATPTGKTLPVKTARHSDEMSGINSPIFNASYCYVSVYNLTMHAFDTKTKKYLYTYLQQGTEQIQRLQITKRNVHFFFLTFKHKGRNQ